ncbi:MAG: carbohydrate-binding domain-containing protein, partial [Oscillospiraceae bacterium]|nr:carbohydrate-binding domain-containing protein [Oscillospiraceae bacterium]
STHDVKIFKSTQIVNAAGDGVRGDTEKIGDADDAVSAGGTGYDNLKVTIKTGAGDGIRASSEDEGKGVVTINGGTVDITSYADGIQAEQEFVMNDGDLNIYTYQGSNFGGTGTSTGTTNPWGGGMGMDGNANKTDISAKGIKASGIYDSTGTTYQSAGNITVNGGKITVDSSDDALHCGGDMYIYGGNFTIASADDAFHSDHSLTIGKTKANTFDDVIINVTKCYEGVEGVNIIQNSGTVYIVSGDDGYNAAGGADGSGTGNTNPWGGGGMSTSSGTLTLNGGLVVVNSASGDHDAFDSNGAFTVTGGYYCANGQEPMDYDGNFSNNGGSFITMQAGNTNLTTRYTFVDNSGNAIVSFLSASGGGLYSGSSASAQSGGNVSGGTEIISGNVIAGGTLSGGTALGQSSGGGMQPGGPGQW